MKFFNQSLTCTSEPVTLNVYLKNKPFKVGFF